MIPLDEKYDHIIDPHNFVKRFPDIQGFIEWTRLGTINDLKCALLVFEQAEMYEYAQHIQITIDEKVDESLGFFDIKLD